MGEMISAIAHQWRQPLNALGISIQNLKYDYMYDKIDAEFIKNYIDGNKKTIMYMSKTIDDFRNFFKVDKAKESFGVKELIEEAVDIQSAQLKEHSIVVDIIGDTFDYTGLKSEFQQVILNILSNAKDALLETKIKNKKISIEVGQNRVSITDNGGGISKDVIDRVFDPYFTTKEQGKGTGIGLYMSKMIIEDNMGAKLRVKNSGEGAYFCIDFDKID